MYTQTHQYPHTSHKAAIHQITDITVYILKELNKFQDQMHPVYLTRDEQTLLSNQCAFINVIAVINAFCSPSCNS